MTASSNTSDRDPLRACLTPDLAPRLFTLLRADPFRLRCLATLATVAPEAWIGAGFVRSVVFDSLCGVTSTLGDIDVIYFADGDRAREAAILQGLQADLPDAPWSVHDQARMHLHNGDAPYSGVADALRHWPEVATAVAVRAAPGIEVLAPFGLGDLFDRVMRPTPHMVARPDGRAIFDGRVRAKRWRERWPGVVLAYSPS